MKTVKPILLFALFLILSGIIQAQPIFEAIRNNDYIKVKELITNDPLQIKLQDDFGNTALHNSILSGSLMMAALLLSNGADIDAENKQLNTPLHEAILNGKDEIARFLINRGANINKRNNFGSTPLHFAARYNRKAIAELLITKGADLESKTLVQQTPLNLLTIMTDYVDMAKFLIEKGADINTQDRNHYMPLNHAAHGGSIELINLLLDYKADFDTTEGRTMEMIYYAADLGSVRLFKYIIAKVGDGVFKNEADNSSIMRSALRGGSLEIVKILQGKNIPLDISANISGWTPVHFAAQRNQPAMMEFLVRNGADINQRTNSGKSAYNIADSKGNKSLMEWIIKLGGNSEPQMFPVLKGYYLGQTPPDSAPLRFAPGIVSSEHSAVTVSPDGQEMYWGSGSVIMMTKIKDGQWINPEVASFSGKGTANFYDDVPFVTPDNMKLFFTSLRPLGSGTGNKENIWFVERTERGWSEPKPVNAEVNAMTLHWQVSVSNSGTLYFGGRSESSSGIYYSRFVNGEYAQPVYLDSAINKEGATCPYIAPDESYIIFARLVSGKSMLHISFKTKEGHWSLPASLNLPIGTPELIVSPDRKYLMFRNWWVSAKIIEELSPKE